MGKLLSFEFRKLSRQKSFYVCSAVLVALVLLPILVSRFALRISDVSELSPDVIDYFSLSGFHQLMASLASSSITIILAVFIPLFVCDDFSSGAIKNVIGKGYSRMSVFSVKYIMSIVVTIAMALLCWITAFSAGTAFWGSGSGWSTSALSTLLAQLLALIAYTSMFYMLSLLIKKSGGSIAIGIVGPILISTVISLVDVFVEDKSFEVSDYWLDKVFSSVCHVSVASEDLNRALICSVLYISVFVATALLLNRKTEV